MRMRMREALKRAAEMEGIRYLRIMRCVDEADPAHLCGVFVHYAEGMQAIAVVERWPEAVAVAAEVCARHRVPLAM